MARLLYPLHCLLEWTSPRLVKTTLGGDWAPGPSLPPTICLTLGQLPDLFKPQFPSFKTIITSACLPHRGGSHDILIPRTLLPRLSVHDWPFQTPQQKMNNVLCSFSSLGTVQKDVPSTRSRLCTCLRVFIRSHSKHSFLTTFALDL